jgi:putative hydrolase of the HAD superfamily
LKQYRHIFFDLDQTLWDFEKNSEEVLNELFARYDLIRKGIQDKDKFIRRYQEINTLLWKQFGFGQINKNELRSRRFNMVFKEFGIEDPALIHRVSEDYIQAGPLKSHLFPYTQEILAYLSSRYRLHIITNGFEEVQHTKMRNSGLSVFFQTVITSESSGYRKPEKQIFYHSLEKSGASIDNCIMIGDSLENDIAGAREVGIDQVFFNPKGIAHNETVTHEVRCLSELRTIL